MYSCVDCALIAICVAASGTYCYLPSYACLRQLHLVCLQAYGNLFPKVTGM